MLSKTALDRIINGNQLSAILRICAKRLDKNIVIIPQCEMLTIFRKECGNDFNCPIPRNRRWTHSVLTLPGEVKTNWKPVQSARNIRQVCVQDSWWPKYRA